MKHQALFSSKDIGKKNKIQVSSAAILLGSLRPKRRIYSVLPSLVK